MQTHTSHANVTKTAIGYVRVSTFEQALEGVSLDAKRDRLRLYCKTNGIKLIDIIADEGISGSTLERPGLQTALRMIKRGRANTLLVAKLDRLSRSVRDICMLVDDLFSDERYHLLSVCGMVNTHNAAGRMLLLKAAAAARARELKALALSLRDIGARLRKEGLVPKRGGKWHAASVLDLLRYRDPSDRAGTAQRARELRAEGLSLRQVGVRLSIEGHVPELGGAWYPARVSALLTVAELRSKSRATHPNEAMPQTDKGSGGLANSAA